MKISPTSPGGSSSPSGAEHLHLARRSGRPTEPAVREPLRPGDDRRGLRLGARRRAPRSRRRRATRSTPPSATAGTARRGATRPSTTRRRSARARPPGASRCAPSSSARRTSSPDASGRSAAASSPRRSGRRARRDCPRAAPSIVHTNGPLWYSGPGIRWVPSICIISSGFELGIDRARDRRRGSASAGRCCRPTSSP